MQLFFSRSLKLHQMKPEIKTQLQSLTLKLKSYLQNVSVFKCKGHPARDRFSFNNSHHQAH